MINTLSPPIWVKKNYNSTTKTFMYEQYLHFNLIKIFSILAKVRNRSLSINKKFFFFFFNKIIHKNFFPKLNQKIFFFFKCTNICIYTYIIDQQQRNVPICSDQVFFPSQIHSTIKNIHWFPISHSHCVLFVVCLHPSTWNIQCTRRPQCQTNTHTS